MIKLIGYYTIFEEKINFGHYIWGDRKRAPRKQNAPQCPPSAQKKVLFRAFLGKNRLKMHKILFHAKNFADIFVEEI